MQLFLKLFGPWVQFVYHCFDRVVLNGYLSFLHRENHVVAFFRNLLGVPVLSKAVLGQRTADYNRWVAAYARNRALPLEWAPAGVRKEELVRPRLEGRRARRCFGVYYILMSMEQGPTFRIVTPKHPTADPNYRIVRAHRSRYRHYYFYVYDEVLGALGLRIGSFLPFPVTAYINGHEFIARRLSGQGVSFTQRDNCFTAVADPRKLQAAADAWNAETLQARLDHWAFVLGPKFSLKERAACGGLRRQWALQQVEYCWNVIFKRSRPIRRLFERCCELSLYLLTADRIGQLFAARRTRRVHGKLQNVMERLRQGMHVFRAYWKHSFVKQYEKWLTLLRLEVVSNHVGDFGLRKGLAHLGAVRRTFAAVLDRFAASQAQSLNVHGHLDLLACLAQPVRLGKSRLAGIKLEQTRMMRLLEVLLRRAGGGLGRWTVKDLHEAVRDQFGLRRADYPVGALRYDLRKLRAHGLIQRVAHTYGYRLTDKGQKVAALMTLLRRRLYGPVSAGQFGGRPRSEGPKPESRFEKAYHKVDQAMDELMLSLAA